MKGKKILSMSSFMDYLMASLGSTRPLKVYLKERAKPASRPRDSGGSVWINKVIRWDIWVDSIKCGNIRIVHQSLGRDNNSTPPKLDSLVKLNFFPSYNIDIREIHGIAASKAMEKPFLDLDEMALNCCAGMIRPLTSTQLQKNLMWRGIRLFPPNHGDELVSFGWEDKRIYVCNSDGSHHLAAARYIAGQLNLQCPIAAPLSDYSFDLQEVECLTANYDIFSVRKEDFSDLVGILQDLRVNFYSVKMPQELCCQMVLLLAKDCCRSRKATYLLRRNKMFDLGEYFSR